MKKISKLKRNLRKAPLEYYVAFSIALVIIFSVVMIILFCKYSQIPDTLCTCFYGTFGGELLVCALIKIFKLKDNGGDE